MCLNLQPELANSQCAFPILRFGQPALDAALRVFSFFRDLNIIPKFTSLMAQRRRRDIFVENQSQMNPQPRRWRHIWKTNPTCIENGMHRVEAGDFAPTGAWNYFFSSATKRSRLRCCQGPSSASPQGPLVFSQLFCRLNLLRFREPRSFRSTFSQAYDFF